jgi:hypothetical protein
VCVSKGIDENVTMIAGLVFHRTWSRVASHAAKATIVKTGGSQYEGHNFMSIAQYDFHVVHMVEYRLDIHHKGAKRRGLLSVRF